PPGWRSRPAFPPTCARSWATCRRSSPTTPRNWALRRRGTTTPRPRPTRASRPMRPGSPGTTSTRSAARSTPSTGRWSTVTTRRSQPRLPDGISPREPYELAGKQHDHDDERGASKPRDREPPGGEDEDHDGALQPVADDETDDTPGRRAQEAHASAGRL